MSINLTRFEIRKLHGFLDLDITFDDNNLVLVGENGSGKTTILRLLYYFLSNQLHLLEKFSFDYLKLRYGRKSIKLKHSDISQHISPGRRIISMFPIEVRERIRIEMANIDSYSERLSYLRDAGYRYRISPHLIRGHLYEYEKDIPSNIKNMEGKIDEFIDSFDAQLIYLPTYRRIEEEFHHLIRDKELKESYKYRKRMHIDKENSQYIELVEFGMSDVDELIDNTLEYLKEFARKSLENLTLGYLSDIVEKKYKISELKPIQDADQYNISKVLQRIGERILSPEQKEHVKETVNKVKCGKKIVEHDKVVCYYFLKLLKFQAELEDKEKSITEFGNVCNGYFEEKEKQFIYDSGTFTFRCVQYDENTGEEKELKLQNLSSGEKQIVSIFGRLYLSRKKRYYLIIDEPELSLSVEWQKKLLTDIVDSKLCVGIVAATHSPFIYENKLEKYAHGIGEFIKKEYK